MTEYGVTATGFSIKPLDVLLSEAATRSISLFGTNIDISDTSPLGKINQSTLTEMSILYEKLNTTYLCSFLDSASGINLDYVVELLGVTRNEAVRSTGYAKFSGTPGTTIPGSTIIKTVDDTPIEFKTDTSLVLADEVLNGGFDTDTASWSAENAATLASVSKKLDFTSGGAHEVLVGDTLTGEISGATAVVSAITISGGTWAGSDAAGTFYFSTQTGTFEAETLKEVLNLDVCDVATDSTDSGGKNGNALLVICDGTNNPYAKQTMAVTAGDFYDLSVFVHEGTSANYGVVIYDETNLANIYQDITLIDTEGDWSTEVYQHIEIPTDCTSISIHLIHVATALDATTMLFDSCELIRVAPITASSAGIDGDVAIGTILSIGSPISGVTEVTNPAITDGGSDKETDVALRIRTKQSVGAGGKATLNAIVAAVLAVGGVSSAIIEENDSATDYIDMLLNSGFPVDTTSWVANNDAVLASVAGGNPGNCLEITGGGAGAAADPFASQTITVVTGDTYTLYVDVKKGTEEDYNVDVWDNDNGASLYASGDQVAAVAWGTLIETSFIIPSGCTSVDVRLKQKALVNTADTIYFDTVLFSGLPPHSVRVSVRGGEDNDIAQAILDSVAGGIQAYGTDYGIGELDNGQLFNRYFARPLTKLISVAATITSDDTYAGDDAVETAIIGYIGGDDVDGTTHAGLGAGGDVLFYEVVSAIMNVTGVTNVALTVDGGTSDISIATIEVAYTTVTDVVIS